MSSEQIRIILDWIAAGQYDSARIAITNWVDRNKADLKGQWQIVLDSCRGFQNREAYWKDNAASALGTFVNLHMGSAPAKPDYNAEELGIVSFKLSDNPEKAEAPAEKGESAVSGLELLLAQPRLATVSQLPSLAARLTDVAEWLERFGESEFDDLASEVRSTARKAGKAPIQQQAALFTEAEELCAAVVELTLALREPTGTQAIIDAGKASGSSEEEILAAAKAISKEKLAEVKLILSQGTNKVVARIQARKAL